MAYGQFHYQEIKRAPEFLNDLGLKPVFIPRQDGCIEYYAFLNIKEDSEVFCCENLGQLVKEAEKRLAQKIF